MVKRKVRDASAVSIPLVEVSKSGQGIICIHYTQIEVSNHCYNHSHVQVSGCLLVWSHMSHRYECGYRHGCPALLNSWHVDTNVFQGLKFGKFTHKFTSPFSIIGTGQEQHPAVFFSCTILKFGKMQFQYSYHRGRHECAAESLL